MEDRRQPAFSRWMDDTALSNGGRPANYPTNTVFGAASENFLPRSETVWNQLPPNGRVHDLSSELGGGARAAFEQPPNKYGFAAAGHSPAPIGYNAASPSGNGAALRFDHYRTMSTSPGVVGSGVDASTIAAAAAAARVHNNKDQPCQLPDHLDLEMSSSWQEASKKAALLAQLNVMHATERINAENHEFIHHHHHQQGHQRQSRSALWERWNAGAQQHSAAVVPNDFASSHFTMPLSAHGFANAPANGMGALCNGSAGGGQTTSRMPPPPPPADDAATFDIGHWRAEDAAVLPVGRRTPGGERSIERAATNTESGPPTMLNESIAPIAPSMSASVGAAARFVKSSTSRAQTDKNRSPVLAATTPQQSMAPQQQQQQHQSGRRFSNDTGSGRQSLDNLQVPLIPPPPPPAPEFDDGQLRALSQQFPISYAQAVTKKGSDTVSSGSKQASTGKGTNGRSRTASLDAPIRSGAVGHHQLASKTDSGKGRKPAKKTPRKPAALGSVGKTAEEDAATTPPAVSSPTRTIPPTGTPSAAAAALVGRIMPTRVESSSGVSLNNKFLDISEVDSSDNEQQQQQAAVANLDSWNRGRADSNGHTLNNMKQYIAEAIVKRARPFQINNDLSGGKNELPTKKTNNQLKAEQEKMDTYYSLMASAGASAQYGFAKKSLTGGTGGPSGCGKVVVETSAKDNSKVGNGARHPEIAEQGALFSGIAYVLKQPIVVVLGLLWMITRLLLDTLWNLWLELYLSIMSAGKGARESAAQTLAAVKRNWQRTKQALMASQQVQRYGSTDARSSLAYITGDQVIRRLYYVATAWNPYDILGVSPLAKVDEIKHQYKRLHAAVSVNSPRDDGSMEALRLLARALDCLTTPEKRDKIDQALKSVKSVGALHSRALDFMTEMDEWMVCLRDKFETKPSFIAPCANCGKPHHRKRVDRQLLTGRYCKSCNAWHYVKEGDIWAESFYLGLVTRYFACVDGAVFDISPWANCQRAELADLRPNMHQIQFRISGAAGEALLDDSWLNHLKSCRKPRILGTVAPRTEAMPNGRVRRRKMRGK